MCLCNFGTLFGQCIGVFISCNFSTICLCFALSWRIRAWQSLVSVDITVSVDLADSIAAFESEKITALSNLFWCRFSRRSAVRMASISPSNAVECCPRGI